MTMRNRSLLGMIVFTLLLIGAHHFWHEAVVFHLPYGERVWFIVGMVMGGLIGLANGSYWYAVGDNDRPLSVWIMLLFQIAVIVFFIWFTDMRVRSHLETFDGAFGVALLTLIFAPLVGWAKRYIIESEIKK